MSKKICLITGATDGVGKVTATELVKRGFTVVMVARNAAKAEAVKQEIAAATSSTDLDYIIADLASIKQVRQLADTYKQRYSKLDVLINNAGVFLPTRMVTEDGFEQTYQVNYLSHFVLTNLLLDELKRSEQGRVINLSSSVYQIGTFDPLNLQSEKRFSVMGAYSASKLFMLMFTLELAKRLRETRVTANAMHPGVVRTQMMKKAPGIFRLISYLALPFSISPQKGATTSVYLASAEDVNGVSGNYFTNSKIKRVTTRFNTERCRESLWDISMIQGLHG